MNITTDPWEEDPEYPVEDWQHEVANDATRLGYLEWVVHQKDARGVSHRIRNDMDILQSFACAELCGMHSITCAPAILGQERSHGQ